MQNFVYVGCKVTLEKAKYSVESCVLLKIKKTFRSQRTPPFTVYLQLKFPSGSTLVVVFNGMQASCEFE